MKELLKNVMPEEEQMEVKELISTIMVLPRADRTILKLNANAFKALREMEKAKKGNT